MNLHRFILAVAAIELGALASGAFVTSTRIAAGTAPTGSAPVAHVGIGIAALVLALGFCIRASGQTRIAAWLTFASLGVCCIAAKGIVWHAVLAHLSIALIAAAWELSSPAKSEPVSAGLRSTLRPASLAMPPLILAQIAMGAMYRHQVTGVMPHMLGAMIVALVTLVVSMLILQHFPGQRELKSAATTLLSLLLAQVCLGIAVFVMLLLDAASSPAFPWLATGHVCVGTLTLAASVVTAIRVRKNLLETLIS